MTKQEWLRKKLTVKESIGVLKRSRKKLDKNLKWLYNLEKAKGEITMADIKEALLELSLEDLEETKTEVANLIKVRKEERKLISEQLFRDTVSDGDEVLFLFKGEEVWGEVVKVNAKSFTAEFIWEEEAMKKPIQFHLFIGKGNESAKADERAAV